MTSYLLDTHVWAWDLEIDRRLPPRVLALMDEAEDIFVSVITFYEIAQKTRIGKWPSMAPVIADLPNVLLRQGGKVIELTTATSLSAGLLEWDHRDPFDRILAATALEMSLPILSADIAFDELSARPSWPGRVW